MFRAGQCFRLFRDLRVVCLFVSAMSFSAAAQQVTTRPAGAPRIIFTVVEQAPEFPGGNKALQKYLADHLKYPEQAGEKFRKHKIFARFIVTETGSIDSARVLRPVNELVDAEVVRVAEGMPAWHPGMQNGHAVAVWYQIPVHFSKDR